MESSKRAEGTFRYKQRRGKPVGRRELAEKHYRISPQAMFYHPAANPKIEDYLYIRPQRSQRPQHPQRPRPGWGYLLGFLDKKAQRGTAATDISEGLDMYLEEKNARRCRGCGAPLTY